MVVLASNVQGVATVVALQLDKIIRDRVHVRNELRPAPVLTHAIGVVGVVVNRRPSVKFKHVESVRRRTLLRHRPTTRRSILNYRENVQTSTPVAKVRK